MILSDYENTIHYWENWVAKSSDLRFDIAIFKIWITTEVFLRDMFILYATGNASEKGYIPKLRILFSDEEHLNALFIQEGKMYLEYMKIIEKKSKYIFENNPFDVIFCDSNNKNIYDQIMSIRNYVAHESGEAKKKYVNICLNGNAAKFREPNEFLCEKDKQSNKAVFSHYTNSLIDIANLLIDPPQ